MHFKNDCFFSGSETNLVCALCANKKEVYVLHPLFDAFLKMKWSRISVPYYIYLLYTCIYTFLVIFNSLEQFSILHGRLPKDFFHPILTVFLPITCAEKVLALSLYIRVITNMFCGNLKLNVIVLIMATWHFLKHTIYHLASPVMLGVLLFCKMEEGDKRIITAVMVFWTAVCNLQVLAEIPSVGIHIMMIRRVAFSALKFLASFSVILFSFCLVFHILLPTTPSFMKLDDSFIKICAMLMGELDFTNSFIKNKEAGLVAKTFFFIFIMIMALVFMNLLLGIAVSDIHELERISKTQSVIIRCLTIEFIERVYLTVR